MKQRLIKFRFYSKILNKFVKPDVSILEGTFTDDKMAVMQYTGFQTAEGTELYEGDILEWYGTRYLPVCRRMIVYDKSRGCYVTSNSKNHLARTPMLTAGKIHRNKMKLIGNIYENPELVSAE